MKEKQHITTNKNQMLKKLYLDTKVEGWTLWFCLPPLAIIL
jgi:hypothetical protein